MIRPSIRVRVGRRARRLGAFVMTAALLTATAQAVTAAVPSNDLVSAPTNLALGVAVDYNSEERDDLGVRPDRLRRLARGVPGALLRFGLVQLHRDQQRPAQPERADDAGQGGRLPRDLVRVPADGLRPDADRLHRVRQRRDVAGQEGPDVPDHGSGPLVGRHGVPAAVRHGRPRHDRDHPHGERSPLQLHRSLHVRATAASPSMASSSAAERSTCGPESRATPRRTSSTTTSGTSSRPTRPTGSGSGRTARASTATSTSRTSRARSTRSSRRRRAGPTP